MSMAEMRESYAIASSPNSRFKQKSDARRRIEKVGMDELIIPSLTDHLKQYFYPPPNEESRYGVSEIVRFYPARYVDAIGTYNQRMRGLDRTIYSAEAFHFKEHSAEVTVQARSGSSWRKTVSVPCSAGVDPMRPEPCEGCRVSNISRGRVKTSEKYAFEVFHGQWYHETPLMDQRTGAPVRKKDSGQVVMIHKECTNTKMYNELQRRSGGNARKCELCDQGAALVFGRRRLLKVGRAHYDNLSALAGEAEKTCAKCHTRIVVYSYHCANCKMTLLDMSNSRMSEAESIAFSLNNVRCQNCSHVAPPIPRKICGFGADMTMVGGCTTYQSDQISTATPMSLSSVVYRLQREGVAQSSRIMCRSMTSVDDAVVPPFPQGFSPKGTVKDAPGSPLAPLMDAAHVEPLKLDQLYAPVPVEDQADILELGK